MLAAAAALITAAAFFASLSWALAAVALAGLVLTATGLAASAHTQAGRPAARLVATRARARRALIETLDGLPELRSFGVERQAAAEVSRQLERFGRSRRQLSRLQAGSQSVGGLLAALTLLGVVAAAAGLLGAGALSAPAFVAACLVAVAVFEPVVGLSGAVTGLARARAASARLTDLFPEDHAPGSATDDVPNVPPGIEPALTPGDTVLLTGPSGSGKSTILRALSAEHSATRVTLVAQDAHVFDGTILDNLRLAAPEATEAELWEALRAAALDDTVAAFPARLDTPVGAGGDALSGGQRRRISVAQGILRRPELLLLDEPTEGLDTETAARLLAGVREHDPSAALVIALHDRQAPDPPWEPTSRIELAPVEPADRSGSG